MLWLGWKRGRKVVLLTVGGGLARHVARERATYVNEFESCREDCCEDLYLKLLFLPGEKFAAAFQLIAWIDFAWGRSFKRRLNEAGGDDCAGTKVQAVRE